MTADITRQRSILRQVLLWNLGLFGGLGITGWMAGSSALLANALDNGSDAAVYLLSYLALDRGPTWKRRAATVAGMMLLLFAIMVLGEVVWRWIHGAEPLGVAMLVFAFLAAFVNLWCLRMLRTLRSDDVNMKAAETFSLNDFVSNGGVLLAGILVLWLGRAWPDLVAGTLIAVVAAKGGVDILRDVRNDRNGMPGAGAD